MPRKSIPIDTKNTILHEAGYLCGNPACRCVITLDMHHLDPVSNGGPDDPNNLIALCPNCHRRHHNKEIPIESLKAWKMLQLSLSQAYDKHSINILLALHQMGSIRTKGDGLFSISAAIASNLVVAKEDILTIISGQAVGGRLIKESEHGYIVTLTPRGSSFVEAWLAGDQKKAIDP